MAYADEIKKGNIVENWLFKIANDNSGFLYFAFSDETYSSNFYHGVILNKPSIRESIDLATSTSKTSNVSITIPDFTYQGSPISEELFGGSNHYINQTITIHSLVNGQVSQIGSCRLIDISSDGDKINLSMTSQRPWDFISFPQDKSDANTFIPIVYGDYTPNTCRHNAYSPNDSLSLFPVPVDYITTNIHCLSPRALNGSSGNEGRLHYWDKAAEQFCPILNTAGTGYYQDTSYDNNSINYVVATPTLHRAYMAKPLILRKDFSTSNWSAWSDTGNIGNAVDDRYNTPSTSTNTSSTINLSILGSTGADSSGEVLFMYPLNFEGQAEYLVLTVTGEIASISQTGNAYAVQGGNIEYNVGLDGILGAGNLVRRRSTTSDNSTFTGDSGVTTNSSSDFKTNYNTNKGWDNDDLQLLAYIQLYDDSFVGTSTAQAVFKIYDVVQTVRAKYVEIESKNRSAIKTEYLYLGCDGLTNSWDSSAITEVHDAHRDLLIRYGGVTTDTPDGWSDLDTSKDWRVRWWQLEPVELKKTLEKLQYEGGFIFRYKADGSPQYIHIKDSHTADETLTKADISNINVKPSSFSNLLTKMDVNYERHPAEKKYLTSQSASNSTSRTNWNVQTKENVKEVNLDAYISPTIPTTPSSNPNDDFYTYYDNIFGDIKLIVSGTIVNPKYYTLEVGNVVSFSDMYPVKAFNTSWTGLKFMITSTTRTAGTMKFEARQI